MRCKYFIAGVADVTIFDRDEIVAATKTLVSNSISINLQKQEVRGGTGGKLLGIYSHSPSIDVTIEDALFNIDYIRLATNSELKFGTDYLSSECCLCLVDGEITVSNKPVYFYNTQVVVGWCNETGETLTFNNKTAKSNTFVKGEYYIIKYYYNVPKARELTISASILPKEIRAVFDIPLFVTPYDNLKTSKRVGKLQIEFPRLILDANVEINMNMTGYSTTTIKGSAIASDDGCEDGYLFKIKEDILYQVDRIVSDIDEMTLEEFDKLKDIEDVDTKYVSIN